MDRNKIIKKHARRLFSNALETAAFWIALSLMFKRDLYLGALAIVLAIYVVGQTGFCVYEIYKTEKRKESVRNE